jgi:predicted transcriptional regulator
MARRDQLQLRMIFLYHVAQRQELTKNNLQHIMNLSYDRVEAVGDFLRERGFIDGQGVRYSPYTVSYNGLVMAKHCESILGNLL